MLNAECQDLQEGSTVAPDHSKKRRFFLVSMIPRLEVWPKGATPCRFIYFEQDVVRRRNALSLAVLHCVLCRPYNSMRWLQLMQQDFLAVRVGRAVLVIIDTGR